MTRDERIAEARAQHAVMHTYCVTVHDPKAHRRPVRVCHDPCHRRPAR